MTEFRMPSLGADMEDGKLTEWRVKPGDRIKRGDIIAEVETQKGIIEIEVFQEGKIDSLLIKEGDKVKVGTVMAIIVSENEPGAQPVKPSNEKSPVVVNPVENPERIKVSPLAKKMATDNGIDLAGLTGTGENGAITVADVEKALVAKAGQGGGEKKPSYTESIRMAVAAAMSKSNREIPHYYLETKIDMSKALAWLTEANKQRNIKNRLLAVSLLVKAVAKALTRVPELNAVWDNGLVLQKNINIGLVVSLRGGGLMVPTLHEADKKSLDETMEKVTDLIQRSRSLNLKSSELSDSTISVTSIGDNGADAVYGVIYPPHVAIIGFGRIAEQAWAENGAISVRPVLTATLAADHRATDGHVGSRFLVALNDYLQKPEEL